MSSKKMFVSALILTLSGALATVSYLYLKHSRYLCETADCLRIAATLRKSINTSVDPCDDFYNYVCGGWSKAHVPMCPSKGTDDFNSWFTERTNFISRKINDLLSKLEGEQPKALQQAKILFESCRNIDSWNDNGLHPLYSALNQSGLDRHPPQMSVNSSNFGTAYAKFKKTVLIGVFFHTNVHIDPFVKDKKIIVVAHPILGNPFKGSNILQNPEDLLKDFVSIVAPDEIFEELTHKNSSRSAAELATSYLKNVIKYVITDGASITNPLDEDSQPLNSTIEKRVNEIFRVLREVASKVGKVDKRFNALDAVMFKMNPDYLTIDELQNVTDEYAAKVISNYKPWPFWRAYLEEMFKDVEDFNTNQKILIINIRYVREMFTVLAQIKSEHLETYLWWTLIRYSVPYLTQPLRKLWDDYLEAARPGQERKCLRTFECSEAVYGLMSTAVVRLYVDSFRFTKREFERVEELLSGIKTSFSKEVHGLDWLDDYTKNITLRKAFKLTSRLGYPDWILDDKKLNDYYEGVELMGDRYYENMVQVVSAEMKKNLREIARPNITNEEWVITPTTLNAVHELRNVRITIPRAILQFPFYNLGLEALNYGAIGSIIGHEFVHGFDDAGRSFDENGVQSLFKWSLGSMKNFSNKADCFVNQYSKYIIEEINTAVKGYRTLNENIADNGGLYQAYKAYQLYKKKHGNELKLPGFQHFTHEQLFFLGFANIWCSTHSTRALKILVEKDVHSPMPIRVLGALQNSKEFSEAWKCPIGSKMNPPKKCKIW